MTYHLTKKRHRPRIRYNHDVIPHDYSFGFNVTFTNSDDFFIFRTTLNFSHHMWEFSIFKGKGWYYEYDGPI